jgi:radical SAM superfamily enzyme YgiQ (UPF0313 family)
MNVYFAQFNIDHGFDNPKKILFFPYSAGCIWAYANQFSEIKDNFNLKEFFIEKVDPREIVESLEHPAVFGFSAYIWNCNYSLRVAKLVKEKFPECKIVFGGPHVPSQNEKWLNEHDFIDYAVYKEGEIVFYNLLRRILGMSHSTSGLGFIENNSLNEQSIPQRIQDLAELPSPYTSGYFDKILKKYKGSGVVLNPIIETNRGCPFKCTFCDWGGVTESKVKKFDMCRVHEELLWMAHNKLEFATGADANFGAFKERDMEIVDFMIETKRKYGYPKYFHTSWHKNQSEHLVTMASKLMKSDMMRSYTASLQSTTGSVLEAIKRKNTGDNVLMKIKSLCEASGFKLDTDLMIPLPGETHQSFEKVLEQCLDNNLTFQCCYTTILPNSEMNNTKYREEHGLETIRSEFAEPHPWTKEEEEILVATNTMTRQEFNNIALLAYVISAFHLCGFMDLIAKYYKKTDGIDYTHFYQKFLNYFLNNEQTLVYRYLSPIANHVDDKRTNETYGGIWLAPMFNELGEKKREMFFAEVKEFCTQALPENIHLDDLVKLQYNWQDHTQTPIETEIKCKSNLYDYIINDSPLSRTSHVYVAKSIGKKKNFISLGHYLNFAKKLGNWNTTITVK